MSDKEQVQETANQEPTEAVEVDPSLPIFPGGPSELQIDAWKEKYGSIEMIEVGGEIFIYRQLGRSEHKALLAAGIFNDEDTDEATVKTLLVSPKYEDVDWDKQGAGVIPTLAQAIMRLSGFTAAAAPMKL